MRQRNDIDHGTMLLEFERMADHIDQFTDEHELLDRELTDRYDQFRAQ